MRAVGFPPRARSLRAVDISGLSFMCRCVVREAILRAMDDPTDELTELRGVLLRELEWRVREGLV